jgi:hypothetical protein
MLSAWWSDTLTGGTTSFFGLFGMKKPTQKMPAVVAVGVLHMNCDAALIGSGININAGAKGIRLRGGTAHIPPARRTAARGMPAGQRSIHGMGGQGG